MSITFYNYNVAIFAIKATVIMKFSVTKHFSFRTQSVVFSTRLFFKM